MTSLSRAVPLLLLTLATISACRRRPIEAAGTEEGVEPARQSPSWSCAARDLRHPLHSNPVRANADGRRFGGRPVPEGPGDGVQHGALTGPRASAY